MAKTYTHQTAPTQYISSPTTSTTYAYRSLGVPASTSQPPVLFLIHFRGTMDYWDPLLINTVAKSRPILLLDNAGVGQSNGTVPDSIKAMAAHVNAFLDALNIKQVDLFGFSMGGMIAQLVTLDQPSPRIRKLIIAGSGPSYGEGQYEHPAERQAEIGRIAGSPAPKYEDGFDTLFFTPSETSQAAGLAWYLRIHERNASTSGEERTQLVSTGYTDGGAGVKAMSAAGQKFRGRDATERADGSWDRLGEIQVPVLILQGHDDFMIPTVNSFHMQQRLRDARLKLYPDSGHGFLYQFAEEVGGDVVRFLEG